MTNIEIIKQWISVLRTGEYKQGKNYLCRIDSNNKKQYCCLGVLCDILDLNKRKHIHYYEFDGYDNRLPVSVVSKLGLGIGSSIDDCGVFVIDGEI